MDVAFLEGSTVGDADGTSAPPASAALELQVWPEPVFLTHQPAPAEHAAPVLDSSASDSDSASEGAASSVGMSRTLNIRKGSSYSGCKRRA